MSSGRVLQVRRWEGADSCKRLHSAPTKFVLQAQTRLCLFLRNSLISSLGPVATTCTEMMAQKEKVRQDTHSSLSSSPSIPVLPPYAKDTWNPHRSTSEMKVASSFWVHFPCSGKDNIPMHIQITK